MATPTYTLAVHGGAGTMDPNAPAADRQRCLDGLSAALAAGRDVLAAGGSALDAVEVAVRALEDDPTFNAGRGAVYTAAGTHELDASIMDGRTRACGAVAGVTTVANPVALARLVMDRSTHVLLTGAGAEAFAAAVGVPAVPNRYFDTPHRFEQLQSKLAKERPGLRPEIGPGTVGAVAVDVHGHLAAATSTGGMTAKRFGRVGDTAVVGAGTYADGNVAVSCTGLGEQYVRHTVARTVAALVEYRGMPLRAAVDELVFRTLQPNDGGLIAVGQDGSVATPFNTAGMYRGVADAAGRFDVHIFDEGTGDGGAVPARGASAS